MKASAIREAAEHIVGLARLVDPEKSNAETILQWLGGNTFTDDESDKIYAVIEELEE